MLLFLRLDIIKKTAINTLSICFFRLVPSIFPFMVLSSILIQAGIINYVLLSNKKTILGICKNVISIVFSSWISGYIVGPRYLCNKETDKNMTNYALLSSNAGVGFVVAFVGIALWNNIIFGILLYVIQILTSSIIFKCANNENISFEYKAVPFFTAISNSIQNSTHTMLEICGFTTFFAIVRDVILALLDARVGIVTQAISSLLEITGGSISSINSTNVALCSFFTGFTVGFGGLCMCFQTFSVCDKVKISKQVFILKKAIQGVVCGIASILLVFLLNIEPVRSASLNVESSFNHLGMIIVAFFLFCMIYSIKNLIKQKINHI